MTSLKVNMVTVGEHPSVCHQSTDATFKLYVQKSVSYFCSDQFVTQKDNNFLCHNFIFLSYSFSSCTREKSSEEDRTQTHYLKLESNKTDII